MSINVSVATEQVSVGSYNDFKVTYDNGTIIRLTVRMIVVNNSDNPLVKLTNVSHQVPAFVNETITNGGILSASRIASLPGYDGITDTAWTASSLVQNDSGGFLRVYDARTGMLLLIDGNTTNQYLFAICYATNVVSAMAAIVSYAFIMGIVVIGLIVVAFFVYVFIIYPHFKRRSIKQKEIQLGSKRKKASEKVSKTKHSS